MQLKIIAIISMLLFVGATNPEQRPLTIMGVGDSLTHGGDSYLPALRELMLNDGYDVTMIGPNENVSRFGKFRQAGYSGKNAQYIARLLDTLYRRYPADIVLLQSGHNNSYDKSPVEDIITAYRTMIATVLNINPEAKVFVAEIVPSGKLPKYQYIPALNSKIRALIKELSDKRVIYVGVAKGFRWKSHTVSDAVHPNIGGGELMAKNWWRGIKNHL